MADTSAVSTETSLTHRHTLHTTDSSAPSSATMITSTTTEPASTSTAAANAFNTRENTALSVSNPPFSTSMNPTSARTTPPTTTTTAPAPAPATTNSRSKTKSSTTTPGPGTGRAKRSKHGCRTCRRRRKKCDETRPTCLGCQKLGIECEGYERPLIWGNGIASRGRLKGATVPTMDMWKPGGGNNGGTGVKRKANGSKNGEGAVRKSPRADDATGSGAQNSTNLVAAAVGINTASSAGGNGDRGQGSETLADTTIIATKAGGSAASVAMPIVSTTFATALDAPLTQTAKVDEVERRESMQSVQSMPSIHSTSTLPSHHGSPGIRISGITKLPHHPRSMVPTTGMSSFALTTSTSALTSTPASAPHNLTGEQPLNAFLNVPSPDAPSRSEVDSPKATFVITSASSPRIDIVDVFSHNDEPLDQELYNRLVLEFFTSGHLTLYSTNKHDSPVLDTVLPLARESLTLRSVCASYQALLSEVPMSQFQAIYSSALQQYRADLGNKMIREKDSTIFAGLLLCTIGASQHLPFTFHIQPVLKLLTMRTSLSWNPFHAHAFEVMGYYDLPSFIVNRRAPRLDIWQTYCMHDTDRSEIEPVSGLPRSLLDIFAKMEDADCEERFWYWYGREGSVMQVHLWDAHRFAGMLKHREVKNDYRRKMRESGLDNAIFETENPKLPPSGVILNRLVACLSVMFRCHRYPDGKDPHLIMNSIFYPLFIAGCQVVRLETPRPDWEEIIKDIFEICSELKLQIEPMQRIIEVMRWKPGMSPDQIAADMGMEIALV